LLFLQEQKHVICPENQIHSASPPFVDKHSYVTFFDKGIQMQYNLRAGDGDPPCRKIYNAEDSFPTGSIRKTGRVFCRPDLVNVQKLDGILYDVKYLVIARNVTVRIIEL
jgi:hypothetical protein